MINFRSLTAKLILERHAAIINYGYDILLQEGKHLGFTGLENSGQNFV